MEGEVDVSDFCAPSTASLPSSVRRTHLSCGGHIPGGEAGLIPEEVW